MENRHEKARRNLPYRLPEPREYRLRRIATTPGDEFAPGEDHLELILLPPLAAAAPRPAVGALIRRLAAGPAAPAELQAQLKRQLAEPAPPADSPTARPATWQATLHHANGARAIFLALPDGDAFERHEALRRALGPALRAAPRVVLNLQALDAELAEGCLLALGFLAQAEPWEATCFGRRACPPPAPKKTAAAVPVDLLGALGADSARATWRRAIALGRANSLVRSLADLPTNELSPTHYRRFAEAHARARGLAFEYWDVRELQRRGAGAFLAVARAEPQGGAGIARITYRPRPRRGTGPRKKLALVGKGICFDTGGYNIKVGSSMLGMHGDMTGSALALALCAYFAEMEADFEVTAYLALAENLISPTAYKPNEVVVASDGTSIEVIDTDAEGRMVLADTLALARREKPDLLIDYATLTYTAIRSLDTRRGAVFSPRADLLAAAMRAGEASGERTWGFPLSRDYFQGLESRIADIRQCAASDHADHIYAAAFLAHFAGADTPWIHLDLAPAENKGGLGLISSDTTGFGVLWTDALVRDRLGPA